MIATADRFRPRGYTLFEWGVVACVLAAVLGVFVDRVQQYQLAAEQVQVRRTVAALRIALTARAAQVVSAEGEAGLRALAQRNPVELLQPRPDNYDGEYYRPPIDLIREGYWYFDRFDKSLVYFPNKYKSFPLQSSKLLRFKVEFLGLPSSAAQGGQSMDPRGLALVEIGQTGSPSKF